MNTEAFFSGSHDCTGHFLPKRAEHREPGGGISQLRLLCCDVEAMSFFRGTVNNTYGCQTGILYREGPAGDFKHLFLFVG